MSLQTIPAMRVASAAHLAWELERRIVSGELAAGRRLDPVRTAAEQLGLAPNTVASAYRALADRGLVVARGRAGTFVDDAGHFPRRREPLVPEGAVDLTTGCPDPALLPDLGPPLAELGGSTATYGDPTMDPALESAAVSALATEGVTTDHLAVASGAVDGMERALATCLRPGDSVAVEDPGWFGVSDLIGAMGALPLPVETDPSGVVPGALAEVVGRVAAVVLTPRAHNPTGAVVTPERAGSLREVLATAPHILVVEDDHMGPVGGGSLATVTSGLPRWVHVRSFSKSLGPDLRLAMVAGDWATIGRLAGRQLVGPGWVSHILQRTVAHLLMSEGTRTLMEQATAAYGERRRLMLEALAGHGIAASGRSGLNVWVPVDDEEAAVRAALEAGYAVRPGQPFRYRAEPAVRITIAEIDAVQADELAAALARPPGVAARLV